MKKKVIIALLSLVLILTLMATPTFAKEKQSNGKPFQEIWDAIAIGPSQEEFDALVDRVTALEAIIYPPFFTSTPETIAVIDQLYTSDINTSYLDAGDVLVITADELPDWLVLTDHGDGTATLAGTPSSEGDYPMILRATDPSGAFDTYECIIHVTQYPTQMPGYPPTQPGYPPTQPTYPTQPTQPTYPTQQPG